jgi:4-diphosphocytidyl-2-C-methyl-D-erythritol kinase
VAPAKVNLTLAVLGRRADGFHDLHSVVLPLALADRLSLAVQPAAAGDSLHVTGADAGPHADNLVLRALSAARAAAAPLAGGPAALAPLAVRLEKRVPVAAGLGGGSSDAAAAIDGALEAWGVELPLETRLAVAAAVGSDVPLFLVGGPALFEGRGERVTPLPMPSGGPPGLLLVTPALSLSTADVFAVFAAGGGSGAGSTRLASAHLAHELRGGLSAADLLLRAGVLASANDLAAAAAAIAPDLVPFRRAVVRRLGRPVGMSGSGPTLWALYPSPREAEAAAADLADAVDSGAIAAPGGAPPRIHATTIASSQESRP